MEIQSVACSGAARPDGRADPPLRSESCALGPLPHRPRARGARSVRERSGGAGGPYALQAAIAACHARARHGGGDGLVAHRRLVSTPLVQRMPSPVVELNRAVAVSMAFGPAAGLAIVDALTEEPSLENYHLLPSVRGDLLSKLGRPDEARSEFERAASLTKNARERALLLERAAACG